MPDSRKVIDLFIEVYFGASEHLRKLEESGPLKNVSSQQLQTLKIIKVEAALTPGRLSNIQGVHKSAISNRIKKLMEKELIQWSETKEDKRSKLVQLTEKGEEIVDRADELIYDSFSFLFEGVKDEDVTTFIHLFEHVKKKLKEREE
ncbi:MarR family transcriptional regulator [Halobacillus sp. BAB-2008]|uniref:MarR family winged helix-turn-helix transcriptional regulator n=1 Tax=Halobacillus sp. BAB-2008 TaxID=1246484 RepID=UPI0002A50431|nr:MarR family transcriptional regulator [Halobacillus sp. BAB-2008]ELK48062.1 MarR family transcriptional regulator [Halobacillus sp. BAB-2008]